MKASGRRKVNMTQRIHNMIYHFTFNVLADDEATARKIAEAKFPDYKIVSVS